MHNLRTAAPLRTPGAHSRVVGCVPSRRHHRHQHHQQQPRRSQLPPAAATAGGGNADDDNAMPAQPDIDQLAAFLTQKAAEMRASMDEQDLLPPAPRPTDDDDDAASPDSNDSNSSSDNSSSDTLSDTLLSLDSLAALASADAAVPAGAALPGAQVRGGACGKQAVCAYGNAHSDSREQQCTTGVECVYAYVTALRVTCVGCVAHADAAMPQGPMSTLDAVSEFEDDRGFISQVRAVLCFLATPRGPRPCQMESCRLRQGTN
jgi:hypothetical protein